MKNVLAIVGSHPETRQQFDFNRTDCDVWVFNEAMSQAWALRADAVFQLHAPIIFRNPTNRNDNGHYDWLKSGNTPVIYMQERYEDVPQSVAYPLEDVCSNLLGRFDKRHFTSSVAYAIALGIHLGYPKIEVYGVEMETDTEYRYQRDGVTFWLGLALGRGIELEVYSRTLFMSPLYGYEGDAKLEYSYFVDRIAVLQENTKGALAEYEPVKAAAIAKVEEFASAGKNPEIDSVIELVRKQVECANNFGVVDGARQENERYKKKADVMRELSGGEFVFCRQEFEQAGQSLMKEREKSLNLVNAHALKLGALFDEMSKINYRDKRRRKLNEFYNVLNQYIHESTKLGMYMGAAIENKRHLDKLTELIRAAGGVKSEDVMLDVLGAQQ